MLILICFVFNKFLKNFPLLLNNAFERNLFSCNRNCTENILLKKIIYVNIHPKRVIRQTSANYYLLFTFAVFLFLKH